LSFRTEWNEGEKSIFQDFVIPASAFLALTSTALSLTARNDVRVILGIFQLGIEVTSVISNRME